MTFPSSVYAHIYKAVLYYRTIILSVVLNGCETWSLILREKHRLRMFENRVLRRIFELNRDEVTGGGKNCIMRSFVICTFHEI
jgi:hypothetical protein